MTVTYYYVTDLKNHIFGKSYFKTSTFVNT